MRTVCCELLSAVAQKEKSVQKCREIHLKTKRRYLIENLCITSSSLGVSLFVFGDLGQLIWI